MISDYYTESIILLDHSSSTGGYWSTSTDAEYTTSIAVDAAVNILSANERLAYGNIGFDAQYKCYADVSTSIYAGRRCRWGGDTFEIVEVPTNTLQKDHHYKFLIRSVGDV